MDMDMDYVRLLEKKVDDLTDRVSVLQMKVDVLSDSNFKLQEENKRLDTFQDWFGFFFFVLVIALGFLIFLYGYPMYKDWSRFDGLMDSIENLLGSYSN
jgi:hypothetical protein